MTHNLLYDDNQEVIVELTRKDGVVRLFYIHNDVREEIHPVAQTVWQF